MTIIKINQEQVQDPATRDLTKAEFNRVLRLSGLDDVWEAVAEYLKANDRETYANVMGELDKTVFRLDYTLAQIAALAPAIAAAGQTIDPVAVTATWAEVAAGG